ncbi:mercury(II) reductase [Ardenticatena maritima]|nr:mercury(II) reductase [Ardenticatena maritima]
MKTIQLAIQGMTCDACARHVRDALSAVPGVAHVEVPGWESQQAIVQADEGVSPERLATAVEQAGYRAEVAAVASPAVASDEPDTTYDLLVIGGGSAGFAAAIKAAEAGARVALIERGLIGGTCVNVGCVPSKTLIRMVEAWHAADAARRFDGVQLAQGHLAWHRLIQQKDALVAELRQAKYVDVLAAYPTITLIRGRARFVDETTLAVDERLYRAEHVIIATGAHPWAPPIPGLAEAGYWTSTDALATKEQPRSLIVIGGSAVGLELAQVYARAGTFVTVLEALPRIVPQEEPEIGEALETYLEAEGMRIEAGVRVRGVERRAPQRVAVTFEREGEAETIEAEHVLVATGRRANTAGLGLEAAHVELDERGHIRIDEYAQTSNPRVYAAGDCATLPMFVYVAAHSGSVAAENALHGNRRTLDLDALPKVTFTDPQVASAGLTESQAREAGFAVKTSVLPLTHVPRALAAHDTRGLIKLVADAESDRLLGAHLLAPEGGEIIQIAVLAIRAGMTTRDVAETIFPYLTLAEGLKLAAQSFEKDVATLSCCAG